MKNKLLSFCLALLLLVALPLTVMAQDFDPDQSGSISVSLVSKDGAMPMAGAELSVFYVATVERGADGKLRYIYTSDFADCGIPMNDPDLTGKLDAFAAENSDGCRKIVTDTQGKACCGDLPLGLYLVRQTGQVEGFAPCASFLVTVPMEMEGGYQYDVDAQPKTDVVRLVDITLRKVWNADDSVQIPHSVTVQLLRGDTVVKTATLSEENQWQVTYTDLPESDEYNIQEIDVPKDFVATYAQNGMTFTVTNTSSLALTGQLIWPIPVLATAGLFFFLVGFAILRKSRVSNA